jgi:hypothetical protein
MRLAAVALLVVAQARCPTENLRQPSEEQITVFKVGSTDAAVAQAPGVERAQHLPGDGPLYVHRLNPELTQMLCFSGAPVGVFDKEMCCASSGSCPDFATASVDSLVPTERDLIKFNHENRKASGTVFVSGNECVEPSANVRRTAEARALPNPEAVPFEFVSRTSDSACSCQGARPEFHSFNRDVTDPRAVAWANAVTENEGFDLRHQMAEVYKSCAFFQSGYGWDNDRNKETIVPHIPPRPMSDSVKINASHVRVPIFGFAKDAEKEAASIRCSGDATIDEDINFCVFGDIETRDKRVIRPEALATLSEECHQMSPDAVPTDNRLQRCCMQTRFFQNGQEPKKISMIRADILAAIGCDGVNFAVNNGDGEFHFSAGPKQDQKDQFEKRRGGREGTLFRDVFSEDLAAFRHTPDESGFHRVCVPKIPNVDRPEPLCHRLDEINVATDTDADLGDLKASLDAIFGLDTGRTGVDYTARLKTLVDADEASFLSGSRAWFTSCLLPRNDTFGNPVRTPACDATGVYNVHPFNADKPCKDIEDIPTVVRGWALSKGIPEEDALIEWSKMPPSFYSAAGSVPLVPADMLTRERCLQKAMGRSKPKDRIFPQFKRGAAPDDATCETAENCCPRDENDKIVPDPNDPQCVDNCNAFAQVLEQVVADLEPQHWKVIWETCRAYNTKDRYLCRLAGQYYTDRGIFRVADDTRNIYAHPTDQSRHVFCTGTFDRIKGEIQPSVEEDDTDIVFLRAGPRTRGLEHPVWEAGGYIGGSLDRPGYHFSEAPPDTVTTAESVPSEDRILTTPTGQNLKATTQRVAPMVDAHAVDDLVGSLVADVSCYLENHRAAFSEKHMRVPGLYPRWLDLSHKPTSECASLLSGDDFLQEPISQAFVDLYGRGGGAASPIPENDFTKNWDFNQYKNMDQDNLEVVWGGIYGDSQKPFAKYMRPASLGICVAPDPNGCAGFCDAGGYAGEIAATVGESLAAVALLAADVLTDGALTPAIAGLEAAEVGGTVAEATSVASKAARTAKMAAKSTAKYTLKGVRGTLKYGKKGLNFLGLKPKHGLMMAFDVAGKVTSNAPDNVKDIGAVRSAQGWRTLNRAQLKSAKHPIRQDGVESPREKYLNTPSMIFTCHDGDPACFRTPEKPSNAKFGERQPDDRWNYEPAMLPTQTLATQMGCHTVFSEKGGEFKSRMEYLQDVVTYPTFEQRGSDGYPNVTFGIIDTDIVRGFTDNKLYYAGDKSTTYLPFVDEHMRGCSLCHLYSGYLLKTARVDECVLLGDDGAPKTMRYAVESTTPHDFEAALWLENNVNFAELSRVELTFYNLQTPTKRTWRKSAALEDTQKAEGELVQRLLGINLDEPGKRLAKNACIGDTSSLGSMCTFDTTLRVHPDHKIECRDNTTGYVGACINPIWANDRRLYFKNSPKFDARAEKLSYCANRWASKSAKGDEIFDDDLLEEMLLPGPKPSMYDSGRSSFMYCENDRLSEAERSKFCRGSDTALAGSRAAMGLRPTARLHFDQVCNVARRRCILYPDDPGGWTFSRVVQRLRQENVGAPFTLMFVPISFKVLVNIPLFATVVDTTWFNDPLSADVGAFLEAAAVEPIFQTINVSWAASNVLAEGFCASGGPAADTTTNFMAMLWAVVELMSVDGKAYSIMSFDSVSGASFETQRQVYDVSEVYPDVLEAGIRTGEQALNIVSAFDAQTAAQATSFAPTLAGRFQKARPLKFAGNPIAGGDTCNRFFAQAPMTFSNVEFHQDSPNCKTLPPNERAPVIAFGQSVQETQWFGTKCVGCPIHGLLARGFDTTQEDSVLATNVNVAGSAMLGATLELQWHDDCGPETTALECGGLDFFSGIALALARSQGNAEVVGCPAAAQNSRCYAESERTLPFLVTYDQEGLPMRSWLTDARPTECDDDCSKWSDADKNADVYCHQAYEWRCVKGKLQATQIFNASNTFGGGTGRIKPPSESECTELRTNASLPIPLLRDALLVNHTEKLPPWVGWEGESLVSFDTLSEDPTVIEIVHDATIRRGDRLRFNCFTQCSDITNKVYCNSKPGCIFTDATVEAPAACGPNSNADVTATFPTGELCTDTAGFFVLDYGFPLEANGPGRLVISRQADGVAETVYTQSGDPVDIYEPKNCDPADDDCKLVDSWAWALAPTTPVVSMRTVALEPCAPEDLAIMSDGAMFVDDDVADQLLQYELAVTLTHRCSTLGCPGGLDSSGTIPVCATTLPSIDADGFFMWHTFRDLQGAPIFSMPHTEKPEKAKLDYVVREISDEAADAEVTFGATLRQLQSITDTSKCLERVGSTLVAADCNFRAATQRWLLLADGAFARIEVPNDPYTCIFSKNDGADPVLVPCPPCFVGSGPHIVGLSNLNTATLPKLVFDTGQPSGHPNTMLVPMGIGAAYGLSVDMATGQCLCANELQVDAYTCPCNLGDRRAVDLGLECDAAAGMLLAPCGRLGAGLAAVDGLKRDMRAACSKILPNVRYSGTLRGRGALLGCNDAGDMVRVLDPGSNFVDREEFVDFPGLRALTSKYVLQPHRTAFPSIVIAPYSLGINATALLEPFGSHIHRVAVQGFDSGPVVWAGVITEVVFICVALLIQCCLCGRSKRTSTGARYNAGESKKAR